MSKNYGDLHIKNGQALTSEELLKIIGEDGDEEWLCEHGVGHSEHVHTCDGCCAKMCLRCGHALHFEQDCQDIHCACEGTPDEL